MKNITPDNRPQKPSRLQRPDDPAYDVGYAKPPKQTRFKKGQSGNPKGRPKGKKNKIPGIREERLKSIILEEAYRDIKVKDGDRQVSVPMIQAIVRTMAMNAAKGNTRSQRMLTEMLMHIETQNHESYRDYLKTMIEYKADWTFELERRENLGLTGVRMPIPHPDDITIDFNNNRVQLNGPFTKEEHAKWEMAAECAIEVRVDIEMLSETFSQTKDPHKRASLGETITSLATTLVQFKPFEDWYLRRYPQEAHKRLDSEREVRRSIQDDKEEN